VSRKVLDPISLSELHVELMCIWVMQGVRFNIIGFSHALSLSTCMSKYIYIPNILEFSYVLSPSTLRSCKLSDPSPLGLESFQVQIHMKLINFLGFMLGHEDLFVYSHVF